MLEIWKWSVAAVNKDGCASHVNISLSEIYLEVVEVFCNIPLPNPKLLVK